MIKGLLPLWVFIGVFALFAAVLQLVHGCYSQPSDPVIHHLIQPNPPQRNMYPENPCYEVRLLKLHLVRPDLIFFPLDTRTYA